MVALIVNRRATHLILSIQAAFALENYFNYFTEIEERYQRRRGAGLLLSTLDWALIETWKDAGIPLEGVEKVKAAQPEGPVYR